MSQTNICTTKPHTERNRNMWSLSVDTEHQKSNSASSKLWSSQLAGTGPISPHLIFRAAFLILTFSYGWKRWQSMAIWKGGSHIPHDKMDTCMTFGVAANPAMGADHCNSTWWMLWRRRTWGLGSLEESHLTHICEVKKHFREEVTSKPKTWEMQRD